MDGPPVQEGIQQLEELIHAIEDLRRRVTALEQRSAEDFPRAAPAPLSLPHSALPDVSPGLLAPIGRLLLGIAGAYLLRAVTEAGVLPELTGTLVGLVYAAGWLMASIRTADSNRVALALEGLTASLIAAPLLWEATTRFHVMTAWGAAAALTFFIVLGQVVAWKHEHDAIAAITSLAGVATAVALITATLDPAPFAIALLIASAVVEFGAIAGHALAWRWIIALAADFCAFLLVYLVTRPHGVPEGYASIPVTAVLAVQMGLLVVYIGSLVTRTIVRRLQIVWFEILQIAVLVGLVTASNLHYPRGVGGAMIAAGAACYLAGLAGPARRVNRNFQAYGAFAVILLIAGGFLLLEGRAAIALWSVAALAATWYGCGKTSNTLRVHGAIYLAAGGAVSARLDSYWILTIATGLAYGLMLAMQPRKTRTIFERVASAVVVALLVCSLFSILTTGLIGARFDPSWASVLRTVLITVFAIALGWAGKHWNLTELIWVLYPWMAFGAVKLFVDDFPHGRPAALAVSLLMYGGTLIALPRLLRRTREDAD